MNLIAGVDEAGRGCIAGPVVAAAVILGKEKILGLMNQFVWIDEKNQSLQNAIEIYVNSYFESIREKKLLLKFPETLAYEIPESQE